MEWFTYEIYDLIQGLVVGVYDIVNSLWNSVCQGLIGEIANSLYDPITGYFKDAWQLANRGYETFTVIGVGLILIYWLWHVQDRMTEREIEWRGWIKIILSLLIPLLLVAHGFTIIEKGVEIGNYFYEYVDGLYVTTSGDLDKNFPHNATNNKRLDGYTQIDEWALFTKFPYTTAEMHLTNAGVSKGVISVQLSVMVDMLCTAALLIIPALTTLIIDIFLVGTFTTRGVMIIFYAMLAPVAMSDAIGHGDIMHSNAVRFVKKFLSVCLQAGAFMLVIKINSMLIASVINADFSSTLMKPFLIMGVTIGKGSLANKAGQFIDTIMGV